MSHARLAVGGAVVAGAVSALALLPTLGAPVALLGAILVGAGTVRSDNRLVTLGAVVVGVGILVAGVFGAATLALLVATAAAVLAWDFGHYAVTLAVGTDEAAVTRNAELVRVAGGTFLAALTVAFVALATLVVSVPTVDRLTVLLLFAGAVLTVFGIR